MLNSEPELGSAPFFLMAAEAESTLATCIHFELLGALLAKWRC